MTCPARRHQRRCREGNGQDPPSETPEAALNRTLAIFLCLLILVCSGSSQDAAASRRDATLEQVTINNNRDRIIQILAITPKKKAA